MTNLFDLEKVGTALRRAADGGAQGGPLARRGAMEINMRDISSRIRDEIQIAMMNWATVEAFNERSEEIEIRLTAGGAWQPAKFMIKALVRDVLMALMRVTEEAGQDRQTLVRVVRWISENDLASITSEKENANYLVDYVPPAWKGSRENLQKVELYDLREKFRPIRDQLIAHATDYNDIDLKADVPHIRAFLLLAGSLSYAACAVFDVGTDELQARWDNSLEEARHFWTIAGGNDRGHHEHGTSAGSRPQTSGLDALS